MNRTVPLLILFFVCLSFSAYTGELTGDYQKKVLDNGASIIAKYVPESPLVTIHIRVLSGLSNEGEYAGSGISHFLEHLLFKGTKDKTSEEIRKTIKAMGGVVNGSTGLDSAVYYITVPNENFEDALVLLADMVTEPAFTDKDIKTERDVVLKEIKLRNDDPISKRSRLIFAQAYRKHVYRYPVIGYEELFKNLTREDIIRYHTAVYTPEKMVIGIVGGISDNKALAVAENKFKEYKRGRSWLTDVSREPRQMDEKKFEFSSDITLGYMAIAFHTTDLYSTDLYACDVLSILLGEGNDSRLYKRLVKDKQLLYTVSSLNYTPRYPGVFVIAGIGPPDKLDQARKEIFAVIEELNIEKIQDKEIDRAKNQVISGYLHSHEQISSMASSATSSQIMVGSPFFFEKYVDEVKKIEKKKIKNCVSKYLKRDNSTTVFLLPPEYEKPKSEKEKPKKKKEKEGPVKSWFFSIGKQASNWVETKKKKSSDVKKVTLKNGLRIIAKRRPQLPLVSVTLAAEGGLRAESTDNNGISNLTASVILKGTKKRTEDKIVPVLEKLGGSIGAFSGKNSMGLSMDLMSKDLDRGLDVFEDVAKNAIFPEEEIAKSKKKIIASINEQENDIFDNGMVHLRKALYRGHPYAMRIQGEIETLETISRKDIITFYKKYFVPPNAVITVAGDIDTEEALKAITTRFAGWKGDTSPISKRDVILLGKKQQEDIVMRKEQALLLMGFQSVRIDDETKYVMDVISSILSGSDGLLFYVAREEEGITYSSGAASIPGVDPGYFVLYIATTEENIDKANSVLLGVLKKLKNGNIPEEEIESSKKRLIAQHAYSLQSNASVSMTMTLDELYQLGFQNYKKYSAGINAVTKENIVQCARGILDLDKCVIVTVHSEG